VLIDTLYLFQNFTDFFLFISKYFYIDGIEEYDTVNVHIVDPIDSDVSYTKNNAIRKAMGLDPLPVSDQERVKLVRF